MESTSTKTPPLKKLVMELFTIIILLATKYINHHIGWHEKRGYSKWNIPA
jgi:hypothetical protein